MFWTRIGTSTGDYVSGTVEEIEKHIQSDKPVMLYFSSQPVVMDTVDQDQITKLKEFKESCKSRGLYQEYDSHTDFRAKFYRHLQLKLNEHPLFKDIKSDSIGEIVKSNTQIPSLSNEARILLKEASLDSHGTILFIQYQGGTDLQANGRNLIPSKERREIAKWESALKELVDNQLLVARGYNDEIFEVTHLGYQIAEMVEL